MKFTGYFENVVRRRRPYLKNEWLEESLKNPIHTEIQPNGRIRRFIFLPEYNKYLRVVFEEDMVHNAFFDRRFKPRSQ